MIINSKIQIDLSNDDVVQLLQESVAKLVNQQFNMDVLPENLIVRLTATMKYGQLAGGPGSPVCNGAIVLIKQVEPTKDIDHDGMRGGYISNNT